MTEGRSRLIWVPLLERVAIAWKLVLDALLIAVAVALRWFGLYTLDLVGGEDWALVILRWIVNIGFILGAAIVTAKDVIELAVEARRDIRRTREVSE